MDGPCSREDAFFQFAASAGSWLLRGYGCWTIEHGRTGAVLGFMCLHMEPSLPEPELGGFVIREAEGRGVAIEAASAVRDWAWSHGLPSLVSYVHPENHRAVDAVLRLGAKLDPEAQVMGAPEKKVYRYSRPQFTDRLQQAP